MAAGFAQILAPHRIRSEVMSAVARGIALIIRMSVAIGAAFAGAAPSRGARNDPMTTATIPRPLSFAGAPLSAWAFGIRIWVAVVVALAASFWLELEAPSSAAVTVAILAAPTRGQALEKARFRLLATVDRRHGSHRRSPPSSPRRSDLILAAFAGWIGLCVFAAGLHRREPRLRGGALRLHAGAHRHPAARYAAACL